MYGPSRLFTSGSGIAAASSTMHSSACANFDASAGSTNCTTCLCVLNTFTRTTQCACSSRGE